MGFRDWFAVPVWHLGVFENRLTLFEPKTGQSAARNAHDKFSANGLLVIDDQILEHELKQLIELFLNGRWLLHYPAIEVTELAWPIAGAEREALRTAIINAGASRVTLPD